MAHCMHFGQLRFLAVDGDGGARLHSFRGKWRLDCSFHLTPRVVSVYALWEGVARAEYHNIFP